MLKIAGLNAYYGDGQVLREVSLAVNAGEVLCLFGRNGAGKSTTLKAVMGLMRLEGSITLAGRELARLPAHARAGAARPHAGSARPRTGAAHAHAGAQLGIGYVPQGRRLFAELTVAENLEIGLMAGRPSGRNDNGAQTREKVMGLFPQLAPRLGQVSGTLSGGEQQMLAMARALCLEPAVLLLDEPTEGLMPSMITLIREVIATLRAQGVAILLVEQRVEAVLPVADRVAFIENGRIGEVVSVEGLRKNPALLQKYVGVGDKTVGG